MCGLIGAIGDNPTEAEMEIVRRAMKASRIRGKHASGVAWFNGKKVCVYTEPIPIDELGDKLKFPKMLSGNRLSLIAHARYSTSDIFYNQPIKGEKYAVAHNGVISQASPDKWEKLYGLECETRNDSELIVRCVEKGESLQERFPNSSIACLILDDNGNVIPHRNGTRPLWMGKTEHLTIYASTQDILRRAGIKEATKLKPEWQTEMQNRSIQ